MTNLHVCSSESPPTDDHECRAAVWSQGRACKKCPIAECYRQGWAHSRVTVDNMRRVAEKQRRILDEKRAR